MTNQQTLTKAIEKAIANGWKLPDEGWRYEVQPDRTITFTSMVLDEDGYETPGDWHVSTFEIIYSHSFPKALWGEELVYAPTGERVSSGSNQRVALLHPTLRAYQYHLQQMVISPDPIKYLGDNIG